MLFARTVVLAFAAGASACAAVTAPDRAGVADDLSRRTSITSTLAPGVPDALPPGTSFDDGLTEDEAVAVALWNNAAFQLALTDLGFARADLVEAGMLRNPVFSLLFPWGPKQLEATVRWPIEAIWQRPRRLKAARLAADSVAARLVQDGLALIADVRIAFQDAIAADARLPVARESARLQNDIARLASSRLAAGDISEMEARAATTDAARSEQDLRRAEYDAAIARDRVRFLTGSWFASGELRLVTTAAQAQPAPCGDLAAATRDAVAARPDVRAAEIGVEAAAARAGWEKSRLLTLTAVLDANAEGSQGFEAGPGIDLELPIFGQNEGGRARANAEIERASRAYVAVRHRVQMDVRESAARYEQAWRDAELWRDSIVRPLERDVDASQNAYKAGDQPYLFVVETARRLTDARLRAIEAEVEVRRAQARMERAIGRSCRKDGKSAS